MELHVNGVKLYYRVSGHGPAVILVHGNGEDHSIFDETAALLSEADSLRRQCLSTGNKGKMVSAVPPDQSFRQGSEDPDDVGGAADHRGRVKTD